MCAYVRHSVLLRQSAQGRCCSVACLVSVNRRFAESRNQHVRLACLALDQPGGLHALCRRYECSLGYEATCERCRAQRMPAPFVGVDCQNVGEHSSRGSAGRLEEAELTIQRERLQGSDPFAAATDTGLIVRLFEPGSREGARLVPGDCNKSEPTSSRSVLSMAAMLANRRTDGRGPLVRAALLSRPEEAADCSQLQNPPGRLRREI
jgi:hypothetical protein